MKKSYLFLAGLALMSAFTACSNDDEVPTQMAQNENTELIVNTVGVSQVNTKAGIRAGEFTKGESLGLYIYRGDGIKDGAISGEDAKYNDGTTGISTVNVPYQQNYNTTGKWGAVQPIMLSNIVGKVYAYYPYIANNNAAGDDVDDGLAVGVTVNEDQGTGQSAGIEDANGQTDYMWADVNEGVSNMKPVVNLSMNHALAMISFTFVQSPDANDKYPGIGQVSSIVLKNKDGGAHSPVTTGNATMNISDGTITGNAAGSITVSGITTPTLMDVSSSVNPDLIPRMLVYPSSQNVGNDEAQVVVTVDGKAYTVDIPALLVAGQPAKWEANKNYEYTLTLRGVELVVNQVTIKTWTLVEGNDGGMDVQNPDSQNRQP
ncbi:MAG: fimbrillin family protein [Parabacteroides sp.]